MPVPHEPPQVVRWRGALLFALGGTILFASFSYDDWRLIARYLGSEVWQGAARRYALARDLREARARADGERREARVEGSIRGLFTGSVQALARCPDGSLLAGGMHSRHGLALARLRADGTLDRAWTERIGTERVVGGVDAVSCDGEGLFVSGHHLADRFARAQVIAARFDREGALVRAYGLQDAPWSDAASRDRLGIDRQQRVQVRLPPRARLLRAFAGPGESALAFFDDRLPDPPLEADWEWVTLVDTSGPERKTRRVLVPPGPLCGVGAPDPARWVSRVAFFDESDALMGTPPVPERWEAATAEHQPGGGWVVRGREGQAPEAPLVWRLAADGRDPRFRELRAQDLGGGPSPRILASLVEPDGRIVLAGTFESVHGQPRSHLARLRPDGSLDD